MTGLVLLVVFYVGTNILIQKNEKLSNTSVFSEGGSGLSLLYGLGEKLHPGSLDIARQIYVDESSMSGNKVIALFSPVASLSNREAELFKKFVTGGGILLVTFHSDAIWANLGTLKKAFGLGEEIKNVENFENGVPVDIRAEKDLGFFRKGERYSFYSSLQFDGGDCRFSEFNCYVSYHEVGKGQIWLMAGLPLVSNGLINRGDNSKVAFRIFETPGKVMVDEFHHFFSSKTLGDLLMFPPFILPILGMVAGLLLFFLFGYSEFYEPPRKAAGEGRSYHDVGEKILMNFVGKEGVRAEVPEQFAQFIRRLFPEKNFNLSEASEPRRKILELISYHQLILKQKGRRS